MNKWLASAIIVILATTGCTVARNETSPSPQNNDRVEAQQTEPRRQEINNSEQVATHLEQLAKGIEGVQDAHCVVIGNTAVVGIDVDAKMERSRVGTIKYSVAEAFRKDPYGIDALVTADMDLAQRLNEIGADIRRGRPVAGFAEEMADIMGRLVPQLPREIMPVEPEKRQDAPKLNKQM
ncbi:YhcN/YlaJ family sporulation lipoprotein [Paenibacillus arenilitoris]|uniref:YhcN/YlaJ family sporulation lipoprotein n=1 Tax=Paenibacillus arenilitoris TaxID=2772299 RepID=A0A927CMT0_9BACL|nr:YhcN/YlaJ family sporulation lipoprotein [Paenibacillus arenilitoris]MBD2870147.1 YhcN/YlaJ family sporulation lipoprotein [Paenibacillus arenilitoris]